MILPVFLSCSCTSSTSTINRNKTGEKDATIKINTENKNIAVLELFTSQGCSSCPPADKLLGAYTTKENIIPLSFHVDYWDRLGWKDPFSSKEYSERQYMYASALKAEVYTPQLIINGQQEMIGSDANKIGAALQKISSDTPDAMLSLKKAEANNGKVNISFYLSGNINNSILNIAVVENKTTTPVKAGENGGATLTDYNVVRDFAAIKKFNEGENNVSIDIPVSIAPGNRTLALYLQRANTNKILAADKLQF